MSKVIVDTDVISFGFRGDTRFAAYEKHLDGKTVFMSFMTFAEFLRGAKSNNWGDRRRQKLVDYIKERHAIVFPSRQTCHNWASLVAQASQKGRKLRTADGWIAANAMTLGIPLVTNNARDFDYLEGITVITEADSQARQDVGK